MNTEQGLMYVLIEHFARQLYPRAREMETKLAAGGRLSDREITHVSEVLEEVRMLRPLFERHPEHQDLAEAVIALYAGITKRALENETAGEPR